MHRGPLRVGAAGDGLEQLAVVVPLDEIDPVSLDEPRDRLEQIRVRRRIRDVEHILVARGRAEAGARTEDPVGVLPREVGVEVDHLGLEPEAELHALGAHDIDERIEPVGPYALVDLPVAEARIIGAAPPEPAVIEHDAFDAHRRPGPRKRGQPVEIVREVHSLPRVQHERPRALRVRRARSHVPVESARHAVEALVRPDEVGGRRLVPLPLGERHLAAPQGLARAEHGREPASSFGKALDEVFGIAAPPVVARPDLAATETELGGAERGEEGVVLTGLAAASAAHMAAAAHRTALWGALPAPLAGEVEQFAGARGHGQQGAHALERVRLAPARQGSVARRREVDREHAVRIHAIRRIDDEAREAVLEPQQDRGSVDAGACERGAVRDVRSPDGSLLARRARPSVVLGGEDPEHARHIGRVVQHGRRRRRAQRAGGVGIERAEGGAPVQHARHGSGGIDHQAHARGLDLKHTLVVRH